MGKGEVDVEVGGGGNEALNTFKTFTGDQQCELYCRDFS